MKLCERIHLAFQICFLFSHGGHSLGFRASPISYGAFNDQHLSANKSSDRDTTLREPTLLYQFFFFLSLPHHPTLSHSHVRRGETSQERRVKKERENRLKSSRGRVGLWDFITLFYTKSTRFLVSAREDSHTRAPHHLAHARTLNQLPLVDCHPILGSHLLCQRVLQ